MKEKERLIQHWKQRKEHYQGKVKSHEESLKHVEKEEEEGVLCVVLITCIS